MRQLTALTIALMLYGTSALAEDHAIGARMGLLGIGVEYSYSINERLIVRGGLNGSGLDFDETESGIDYAFDLDFDSMAIGVDFHPFTGAFRVSGGLLKNDNTLTAVGQLSSSVTIGDDTYDPDDVGRLTGSVGFDSTAPYLAVGWDFLHDMKVGLSFELGLVKQGAPVVRLSASGPIASDPAFMDDIETERRELESDLDDLDIYPFAMLGLVVRF
jgi:hypothetical protein